ncbi:MAG: hypothetical protein ACOYD0_07800 [Candidatus Nanopelagicales bacterium]
MSSHQFAQALESHLNDAVIRAEDRLDEHVDWRAVKVASWGLATASVLGAVAAGFAAVAAGAGAVILVRKALHADEQHRAPRFEQVSTPAGSRRASVVESQSSIDQADV